MKFSRLSCLLMLVTSAAALSACGDDEKKEPESAGGAGGSDANTGGGGAGGGGGSAGEMSDASTDASSGGTGGSADVEAGPEASTDAGKNLFQGLVPYLAVRYPAQNQPSADKAMLGKILFWEEQIGEDDTMACGTCHRAGAGGSDPRAVDNGARQSGPNGVFETQPDIASDDVRGAQGIKACTDLGVACQSNTDCTGLDGGATGVCIGGKCIAYTDPSAPVQVTGRKPPTYLDAMFAPDIFWDGRATRNFTDPLTGQVFTAAPDPASGLLAGYALESQSMGPPVSDREMACAAQNWNDIVAKLATVTPLAKAKSVPPDMESFITGHGSSYPNMFAAVYGDQLRTTASAPNNEINTTRIAFAIATHERRLTSDQTPWDLWNAGDNAALTPDQVKGFEHFMVKAKCNTCHVPPLFTDFAFHFIGFHDPTVDDNAAGRQTITLAANNADLGKMKTPSLRNVGLREAGGLLHQGDGPGHDLQTVMQLYNSGGRTDVPVIASVPIDGLIFPLNLTQTEIDQIIDFLRNGLTDPRAAAEEPPFDRPKLGTEL